jgi:tRNA(Ile)-lysidine synthase
MKAFEQKIVFAIVRNNLFTTAHQLLVGVSGGRDSMALLHYLQSKRYKIAVAHVNYQLRGADSDRDEQIVRTFCETHNIPIYVHSVDTQKILDENGGNMQKLARTIRYDFFNNIAQTHEYQHIVTAHHLSDNVETTLYNFQRGTGLKGMRGIKIKNGNVVRPFLCVTRNEIDAYILAKNIEFGEDVSNQKNEYSRNFIRNRIIPTFEELNSDFEKNALKSVDLLKKQEQISTEKLLQYPHQDVLLFELFGPYGFNPFQCQDMVLGLKNPSNKQFLSQTHEIFFHQNYLIISELYDSNISFQIEKDTKFECEYFSLTLSKVDNFDNLNNFDFVVNPDHLQFPLTIRNWQEGDRFKPLGMKGMSKRVSDLLQANKLSAAEKKRTWIIESAGQIVWVVGLRGDHRFGATIQDEHKLKLTFQLHS